VPVDFERDALDSALGQAGHDETRPTTWVWEGVVMYLTPADIAASLAVIQRRSAPGSRLIVAYHAPALLLKVIGLFLKRLGEPLRSALRPRQMRALLAKFGFEVSSDQDLASAGYELSAEIGQACQRVKHLHVAVAERTT